MWELLTRDVPFGHLKTAWSIRDAVVAGERPSVPPGQPPLFVALMRDCWCENPRRRPAFSGIVQRLQTMNPALPGAGL